MRIQDFNAPPPAAEPAPATSPMPAPGHMRQAVNVVALKPPPADGESRAEAELALLRARVEHLELVIETARGLMTANQERLLRRLHEMPREMTALSLRLQRLGGSDGQDLGQSMAATGGTAGGPV